VSELSLSRFWRGFWQVADPKIWVASTIPMAVGGALAYGLNGHFNWYWFLVGVAGVYFIEIGKNAANDLFDYKSGVDLMVAPDKITPFSGGKRAIVDGNLTIKEAALITVFTLAAGAVIGLYIAVFREPAILWIGCTGLFFAAAYSIPPFKLAYRGLGEILVGITFGPLIVSGTYLVQTHTLNPIVFLASLPIGFLIANVLWINQYPDYEADLQGKKLNQVVRIGKVKGIRVYAVLFALAYVSLLVLSIASANPFWLLAFIGIPLVLKAVRVAASCYDDIPNCVTANINTIKTYQITGLTMILAAIMSRFF
jgi:1,4-dihydroxy-2-naphthoate polyprenyltransferase